MRTKGFTQSSIARSLDVTRAAVSKWVTGLAFPRPPELLKLGKLVGLGYSELVEDSASPANQPLVAFRKRAGTKTTPEHVTRAREMGVLLASLVKRLPFDRFLSPARLKQPLLAYGYLQELVRELRRELRVDPAGPIKFEDLIGKFNDLQAVIIPVLWGRKQRHENALHVYLPESKTTWIYLNLDSHLHDFKFWMAHELGHVLAVDLLTSGDNDRAEDFSDAFAGALLFPEAPVADVYSHYVNAGSNARRMQVVFDAAKRFVISPNTVHHQLMAYAEARVPAVPFAALPDRLLFAAITRFNQGHPCVSEMLFGKKPPSADEFVAVCAREFKTPFFAALRSWFKETSPSDATVGRMLDLPLIDAKNLRLALT